MEKKRKRGSLSKSIKNDIDADGEDEDVMRPEAEVEKREVERETREPAVKQEKRDSWSEYESGGESDGDSEDEIPLAKLRKAKIALHAAVVPGFVSEQSSSMGLGNGSPLMMPPYHSPYLSPYHLPYHSPYKSPYHSPYQQVARPTAEFEHFMGDGEQRHQMAHVGRALPW